MRPDGFRERVEELERASFSTWAVLSIETKGRDRHEEPDRLRTTFQVDAHRIQRSRGFHLLAGKGAPVGPTGTTWLTVALEAARLAESLSRALRLNTDLARAVALGHALGAAPLGTAGARALADFGYSLAEQSLRVTERLEGDGAGLNLTWETRDGVLTVHGAREPATAEGQAARLAVHITEATLGPPLASEAARAARRYLGDTRDTWGDSLVRDAAVTSADRPEVRLSERGHELVSALADAAARVQREHREAQEEHHRAMHCLQSLAIYALEQRADSDPGAARRRIVDDLTSRTDREIVAGYRARFEPRV